MLASEAEHIAGYAIRVVVDDVAADATKMFQVDLSAADWRDPDAPLPA